MDGDGRGSMSMCFEMDVVRFYEMLCERGFDI